MPESEPIRLPAPGLLALNRAHEVELSPLDAPRFAELVERAFFARAARDDAFLLAFDQDADYDSPNFLWFRERLDRFVYVDRIVVDPAARGGGLARVLYTELFEAARAAGHDAVVAEVNSDPPNPGSDAFHAAMGFEAIGEARLADRGKSVRYLRRTL